MLVVTHHLVGCGLLSVSSVSKPLLSETMTTEEVLISTVPQKVMWEQSHNLHADTSVLRKEWEDLPAELLEVPFAVEGC